MLACGPELRFPPGGNKEPPDPWEWADLSRHVGKLVVATLGRADQRVITRRLLLHVNLMRLQRAGLLLLYM